LIKLNIKISTAKRLEKLRLEGQIIDDVIRNLIYHYSCCTYPHKLKKTKTITVSLKLKSRFFALKPSSWSINRFMKCLLDLTDLKNVKQRQLMDCSD